jgi:hypothetical protein
MSFNVLLHGSPENGIGNSPKPEDFGEIDRVKKIEILTDGEIRVEYGEKNTPLCTNLCSPSRATYLQLGADDNYISFDWPSSWPKKEPDYIEDITIGSKLSFAMTKIGDGWVFVPH